MSFPESPPPSLKGRPTLWEGATAGVIAPSFPLAAHFPQRHARSVQHLAEALRANVEVAPHVGDPNPTHTQKAKTIAWDLQQMLLNPEIQAVFTTVGGLNSIELLPHLSWEALQQHGTAVVGYSDTTALLLGLYARTGCTTLYGPALMPQFGEYPGVLPYTLKSLLAVLRPVDAVVHLEDPTHFTDEFLDWGQEPANLRPRTLQAFTGRQTWKAGAGLGTLFGGNLETLAFLLGTPYFKPPQDVVFFWEATAMMEHPLEVRRVLTHLKLAGFMDHVRAMLIGYLPPTPAAQHLQVTLLDLLAGCDFPIVANLPFGHKDPIATLPIGATAHVQADASQASISIHL